MKWLNIVKFFIALEFVAQYALTTLALTGFIGISPLLPLFGIAVDPVIMSLAIIILPLYLLITLKLLGWFDVGIQEIFGLKLQMRKRFVAFRNSITKGLPRVVEAILNFAT